MTEEDVSILLFILIVAVMGILGILRLNQKIKERKRIVDAMENRKRVIDKRKKGK